MRPNNGVSKPQNSGGQKPSLTPLMVALVVILSPVWVLGKAIAWLLSGPGWIASHVQLFAVRMLVGIRRWWRLRNAR